MSWTLTFESSAAAKSCAPKCTHCGARLHITPLSITRIAVTPCECPAAKSARVVSWENALAFEEA